MSHLIVRDIELFKKGQLQVWHQSEGSICNVETLKLAFDAIEDIWMYPLKWITGQIQPQQIWHTTECLIVNCWDVIVSKAQGHQRLDLIQLGIWDGCNLVSCKVEMFQSALDRVESFYGDLGEAVVSRIEDFQISPLEK